MNVNFYGFMFSQNLLAWSNATLARRQLHAVSITDFASGILLTNLIELAFNTSLAPTVSSSTSNNVGNTPFHHLNTTTVALRYLNLRPECAVCLGSVDSGMLVEVQVKPYLLVIWAIVRSVTMQTLRNCAVIDTAEHAVLPVVVERALDYVTLVHPNVDNMISEQKNRSIDSITVGITSNVAYSWCSGKSCLLMCLSFQHYEYVHYLWFAGVSLYTIGDYVLQTYHSSIFDAVVSLRAQSNEFCAKQRRHNLGEHIT